MSSHGVIPAEDSFASQQDIQSRIFKSKKEQAAWDNLCKYLKKMSKTEIGKDMRIDKPKPSDYDPNSMPFDDF